MHPEVVAQILALEKLDRSGHATRAGDQSLGLGWLYYALARIYRPKVAVVIGSWRGFVPIVLGHALRDNGEDGEVVFVDPSLVDDFWKDSVRVRQHFADHGVKNVRHYCMTTQEFVVTAAFRALPPIGLLFVDGYHTAEQAEFDYTSFVAKFDPGCLALFHDSQSRQVSKLYAEPYEHSVRFYIDKLRAGGFQVFDVAHGAGVALVLPVPVTISGDRQRSAVEVASEENAENVEAFLKQVAAEVE